MITIEKMARAAMEAHAVAAYPEECCGLLIGREGVAVGEGGAAGVRGGVAVLEVVPAQNLAASNRGSRFMLDPRGYMAADRVAREKGLAVVGCYHSHPDHPAIMSATDESLAWEGFLYVIVPVTGEGAGKARGWRFFARGVEEEGVGNDE